MKMTSWRLAASLALCSTSAFAAAPPELNLYAGRPLASWHVSVADSETSKELAGDSVEIVRQSKVPASVVGVGKASKSKPNDALTLRFKDAGYSRLRLDSGKPVDLRPYAASATGVLALDVNVKDMANGGITFKVGCGDKCERSVPYLMPARAIAGKGWRHLVFSMRCFMREGDDFSAVELPFALDGSGSGEVSIANVKYQTGGKPNAECPDYQTVSVTPDKLNESWSVNWWTARHEQKLAEVKALGKRSQLVFIGDSITQNWEKAGAPVWERNYQSLNGLALGFGGDRTENVLWRLLNGEVDGIAPKVAVLLLGTNNTGHRQEDPKTTALGIKRNIDELRQRLPDTKILLLAIFPRGETPDDPLRRLNERVNGIISGYADNQNIFFLNINQAFLAADGTLSKEIMPDLLHPNEQGYEIWAKAMAPTLAQLLPKAAQP